jgi:hypothetical protein
MLKKALTYFKKSYQLTTGSIKKFPVLILPFAIFCLLELFVLIVITVAPRQPFVIVLGPPIRTLWGDVFLHYPSHFLIVHKLMSLSRMFLAVIAGSLMTGITVYMVGDIYNNKKPDLVSAFTKALKKYVYFFIVTFLVTALFYLSAKFLLLTVGRYFAAGHARLLWIGPKLWLGPMLPTLNFILALGIQSVLIYMIPLIAYDNCNLLKAFFKSFAVFLRLAIPTVLIILIFMLCYIPVTILKHSTPFLINRVFPEFVLIVAVAGIIVGNLVVDALITISTAFLYLEYKNKKR